MNDYMEWIDAEPFGYDKGTVKCSACGAILEPEDLSRHYYRYCYHCGRRATIGKIEEKSISDNIPNDEALNFVTWHNCYTKE